MPMFYAAWADGRPGFLCEAIDLEMATKAAAEECGAAPTGVRMLQPCAFGALVHFTIADDDEDTEEVALEPLDHVVALLGEADDAILEPVEVLGLDAPALPALRLVECIETATGPDGHEVKCTKPADGHGKGQHRAGKLGW